MAQVAEVQRISYRRFRWEELGFELDNLEKGMDDDRSE